MRGSPWRLCVRFRRFRLEESREFKKGDKGGGSEGRTRKGKEQEGKRGRKGGEEGLDREGKGNELIRFLDVFNHVENSTGFTAL